MPDEFTVNLIHDRTGGLYIQDSKPKLPTTHINDNKTYKILQQ